MNDTIVIIMVALTALVAIAAFALAILAAIWKLAAEIVTATDKIVYMMAIDSHASKEDVYGRDDS